MNPLEDLMTPLMESAGRSVVKDAAKPPVIYTIGFEIVIDAKGDDDAEFRGTVKVVKSWAGNPDTETIYRGTASRSFNKNDIEENLK